MRMVWWILFFSWILYPVSYAIPALFPTAEFVAARQVLYSIADITSKLIFGIVLARVALIRSAEDGFAPAIETLSGDRDAVTR